ncbi:MAG TPA: hypothetical protein VFR06_04010 [Gallionellaceae bacterium]|nr:hypothetical protein [Gallionellaceae bacterium]
MTKRLLLMLLLSAALPVRAAGVGGMFAQGNTQFSLMVGNSYAFDTNYMVIGASASHYVIDGLGIGLSLESWSGSGPGITSVSPFAQYVFHTASEVQPYVGAFYRHTSIADLPSINSVGERAGIYITSSPRSAVGFGLVHESYLDCNTALYRNCSSTYSDVSLTFAF